MDLINKLIDMEERLSNLVSKSFLVNERNLEEINYTITSENLQNLHSCLIHYHDVTNWNVLKVKFDLNKDLVDKEVIVSLKPSEFADSNLKNQIYKGKIEEAYEGYIFVKLYGTLKRIFIYPDDIINERITFTLK